MMLSEALTKKCPYVEKFDVCIGDTCMAWETQMPLLEMPDGSLMPFLPGESVPAGAIKIPCGNCARNR